MEWIGLEDTNTKTVKTGHTTLLRRKIPDEFFRHYPRYLSGKISKSDFSRLCRVCRPTLTKYIRLVEGKQLSFFDNL